MSQQNTSIGGAGQYFPDTCWSKILAAADPEDPGCQTFLAGLLEQYWKPIYAYIRVVGRLGPEEAKDLTQSFIARFLEKRHVERLNPDLGNFRSFLKRSIRNFLIDSARRRQAREPAGERRLLSFEHNQMAGEAEPAAEAELDAVYEREWVLAVLEQGLSELEQRLEDGGMSAHFETFRAYCLPEDADRSSDLLSLLQRASGASGLTYQQVAARLDRSEIAVRNQLAYCRRQLRAILRRVVLRYVGSDQEVDGELREILFR